MHSPTGDRDLPHLEGLVVSQIAVDGALRLRLQPGLDAPPAEAVEVVVESTFVHRASDGSRTVCDPTSQPPAVAAALGLVHRTLEWASVSEQGELALGFDDASGLVVWAHPEFEAWQIVGPGRALVVCLPGGGAPAEWG